MFIHFVFYLTKYWISALFHRIKDYCCADEYSNRYTFKMQVKRIFLVSSAPFILAIYWFVCLMNVSFYIYFIYHERMIYGMMPHVQHDIISAEIILYFGRIHVVELLFVFVVKIYLDCCLQFLFIVIFSSPGP